MSIAAAGSGRWTATFMKAFPTTLVLAANTTGSYGWTIPAFAKESRYQNKSCGAAMGITRYYWKIITAKIVYDRVALLRAPSSSHY
jgi:hypothetical protein